MWVFYYSAYMKKMYKTLQNDYDQSSVIWMHTMNDYAMVNDTQH